MCDLYAQTAELHAAGVHVVSVDEKTGMQAVERLHPTKPTRPGFIERREFEYIRHGTLCLTANFEVATGRIITPRLAETRTNIDFVEHIQNTVASDPSGTWVFVADNLDPHKSEALIRWVASQVGFEGDLGKMSKKGILKSRATRTAFLSNPEHRIRFVFTPRHCSWMNQVEIWFSVLARRLLRRGNFTSKADLADQVTRFIDYFNRVLAKPYRWTYTGRPLRA
ncbi:MAG: IS630 family transposase [Proteobacteria bacterium]|nr:IS630 family transposase [Pseudomonadota bacterium]